MPSILVRRRMILLWSRGVYPNNEATHYQPHGKNFHRSNVMRDCSNTCKYLQTGIFTHSKYRSKYLLITSKTFHSQILHLISILAYLGGLGFLQYHGDDFFRIRIDDFEIATRQAQQNHHERNQKMVCIAVITSMPWRTSGRTQACIFSSTRSRYSKVT